MWALPAWDPATINIPATMGQALCLPGALCSRLFWHIPCVPLSSPTSPIALPCYPCGLEGFSKLCPEVTWLGRALSSAVTTGSLAQTSWVLALSYPHVHNGVSAAATSWPVGEPGSEPRPTRDSSMGRTFWGIVLLSGTLLAFSQGTLIVPRGAHLPMCLRAKAQREMTVAGLTTCRPPCPLPLPLLGCEGSLFLRGAYSCRGPISRWVGGRPSVWLGSCLGFCALLLFPMLLLTEGPVGRGRVLSSCCPVTDLGSDPALSQVWRPHAWLSGLSGSSPLGLPAAPPAVLTFTALTCAG